MAKLVYIGFPSPLTKASCISLDTNEEVEVTQVSRGICQDISVIPEKKGKYKIELEFDYDPGVLSNISNIKISGSNKAQEATTTTTQDVNSFALNIPGLDVKPNDDGSMSFLLKGEDGSTTEVNADIPGMNVVKNEDGTVMFSMPDEEQAESETTTTNKEEPNYSSRTTRTTTTITKSSVPAATQQTIVSGQFSLPRAQQNINIKLPCPKHHQENLKTACTGPDGSSVPTNCTIVDDDTINLGFSPSQGNGTYSLNLLIADKVFPGCPIQLEVKGL
ncbi:uncharacterized protein LOC134819735 [Bolinopsis microptera]|uniref:uncharacterized protein LOC134819735 n=1 Tax=Bolinopsis microptera TaxID=2820187 RepID=UPI0030794879